MNAKKQPICQKFSSNDSLEEEINDSKNPSKSLNF